MVGKFCFSWVVLVCFFNCDFGYRFNEVIVVNCVRFYIR